MNKKKVILVIIIFIFLGLTIFTFANPKEDETQTDGVGSNEKVNTSEMESTEHEDSTMATTKDENGPIIYLNTKSYSKTSSKIKYFKKTVKVNVEDENLSNVTLTKNSKNVSYEENKKLTKNGKYVITATDDSGNKTKIVFVVDKTAPTISIDSSSVGEDGLYSRM